MKKSVLILLSFVPIIVGYVINRLILLPGIGMILFYVLPLLTTVFWFYLGRQYSRSAWKALPSVLIAHAAGICSLLIYLWQFLIETSETRNLALAAFSQMFSASTPMYLFGGLARLFEGQPDYAGRTSLAALQFIALLYMILVFCAALFREKKKSKDAPYK